VAASLLEKHADFGGKPFFAEETNDADTIHDVEYCVWRKKNGAYVNLCALC